MVAVLGVTSIAAVAALLYGPGYVGYDAAWSLVWGAEVVAGEVPSFTTPFAPTPHPLANAAGALAALGPHEGEQTVVVLSFLAFGALVLGAFVLGRRISEHVAGGIAAAVLVATIPLIAREVAFASLDVPYLALVVWALVATTASATPRLLPLVLLVCAGLLRPEAWVLALAMFAWIAATHRRRPRTVAAAAGLMLAAPVAWAVGDLAVTGEPLWSFTGTRDLAAALQRPRGLGTAVDVLGPRLAATAGALLLAAAACGTVAVALHRPRHVWVPSVVVAVLGAGTYLGFGLAGLPLLDRYLLLPVVVVACLAGAGAGLLPGLTRARSGRVGAVAAGLAGLLALASLVAGVDDLSASRRLTHARADVQTALRDLAGAPRVRAAAGSAPVVRVPDFRTRPVVALRAAVPVHTVEVGNLPDGECGLVVTYANEQTAFVFNLGAPGEVRLQAMPLGGRVVAENDWWRVFAAC